MELDLTDAPFDTRAFPPREIEEVFEDPFSIRLLPENERADNETRYYLLGKTVGNRGLFLAFWTNGKQTRVHAVREMSDDESAVYDRKMAEFR